MRIDRLLTELPEAKKPDPNAAAALQELLGGKYGEMSTLGNYMFQSFNFRNKTKLRPFYSLVSSIFAEELGHVELVSTGIAMLNNGKGDPKSDVDISKAPFHAMQDTALPGAFLSAGGGATPINSNGISWNTDMVTTTGNLMIDLLHNFHLECGARIHKLRVYETMTEPTGTRSLRLSPRSRLAPRPRLRASAKEADRRRDREDATHAEYRPRPHPRVSEIPGRGQAPPPLPVQPGRLRGSGRHLVERRSRLAG